MKHHQVSKVPRGSSALGWQSRGAALPCPCALQGGGLSKRRVCPVWGTSGKEEPGEGRKVLQGCGTVLVHLGTLKLLVLRLGM